MLESDVYTPHSYEEMAGLVTPEVLDRLDPGTEYGIQWFNRRKITTETYSEPDGEGGRRYKKRRKTVWRPREEWIAVPVPTWLPRDLVQRARHDGVEQEIREKTPGTGVGASRAHALPVWTHHPRTRNFAAGECVF